MYIKHNESIRAHSGTMLNGVVGDIDKNYNSLANSLDLEPCNIATFSELNATKRARTSKYLTVLEDEECVILTSHDASSGQENPVGLVFRAVDIKKYLIKTTLAGKSVVLQEYITTILPYTLGDAAGSTYVNSVSSYWYDPSRVVLTEAGETNNLASYAGADGTSALYDWYNVTTASEDYVMFTLVKNTSFFTGTGAATFDLGYLTTDIANINGIYNAPDVIRINEF